MEGGRSVVSGGAKREPRAKGRAAGGGRERGAGRKALRLRQRAARCDACVGRVEGGRAESDAGERAEGACGSCRWAARSSGLRPVRKRGRRGGEERCVAATMGKGGQGAE